MTTSALQPIILDADLIRDEINDRLDNYPPSLSSIEDYTYREILNECSDRELLIALHNAVNNHDDFFEILDQVISDAIDQLSASIN